MFLVAEGELEAICISDMSSERKYSKVKLCSKLECESRKAQAEDEGLPRCSAFITPQSAAFW